MYERRFKKLVIQRILQSQATLGNCCGPLIDARSKVELCAEMLMVVWLWSRVNFDLVFWQNCSLVLVLVVAEISKLTTSANLQLALDIRFHVIFTKLM